MTERLSSATVAALPVTVATPGYDRSVVTPGIVHLGLGAFHRAHQAAYVDDCLGTGDLGWGIVGASLRSTDTRDALGPQDGLYTLAVRSGEGEQLRVVGSVVRTLVAPEDPGALLDALTDTAVRIVTLTVTEKAYLRKAGGGLDADHPDIAWDLAHPDAPKTAHGFILEAVARRRAASAPTFTVLSCDNLPANGVTLRRLLIEFATLRDPQLAGFVENEVAFPSSMVDRIVPATTDEDRRRISQQLGVTDAWPVMTEPFSQWVVEDCFPAGRPDWERFGVEMVADVGPFEDMKLRLLNGSHSALAYLGLLSGHATVAEAFADPAIRSFVARLWAEAIPTLPAGAGLDPQSYVQRLAERYRNTALKHRTAQIAMDGSQKLPQRIVATALERLRHGEPVTHLALAVAAWIAACEARGRSLTADRFQDPLDNKLSEIAGLQLGAADTVTRVFDAAGFAAGDPGRERLKQEVAAHLATLRVGGVQQAIAASMAASAEKTA